MVHYDPTKTTSFETLPKAIYPCRVEDIREKSSERGTKWTIWFRVTEGEHESRVIFDDQYFYGRGLEHVALLLEALGRNPQDEQEVARKDLLDLVCRISVDIKSYEHNGETRNKNTVSAYNFSSSDDDLPFE